MGADLRDELHVYIGCRVYFIRKTACARIICVDLHTETRVQIKGGITHCQKSLPEIDVEIYSGVL